jgi:AcrR family transcriptional regulator
MIENRARILDAAARVYAEFGYRGATTRRIAVAAGVNEVTLFRTFGSKAALIDEAVRSRAASAIHGVLPAEPVNPERELTEWATGLITHLREQRSLIRKSMGELEERPQGAPCVAGGLNDAAEELRGYMRRLCEVGLVDWARIATAGKPRRGDRVEDAYAAGTMLMAALFSDAMGREMMPGFYPEPADRAPALYVRLFLRAVGCELPSRRRTRITPKHPRS